MSEKQEYSGKPLAYLDHNILDGFLKIQELVGNESLRRRNGDKYKQLMDSYGIQ